MAENEYNERHKVFEFGGFRLDPAGRRLSRHDGTQVPLQPRVYDLLLYFVSHAGELLDKHALMQAVWPDVVVDENSLNQAVSALRRVLGENRAAPRFIATVPRRGYQFIAPVGTLDAGKGLGRASRSEAKGTAQPAMPDTVPDGPAPARGTSPWLTRTVLFVVAAGVLVAAILWRMNTAEVGSIETASGGAASVPSSPDTQRSSQLPASDNAASIAILPFRDLSPQGDQAYFADGLAEEILNRLSLIEDLRVSGRTSSFALAGQGTELADIGAQLGVAHVLEGGVRIDGNRLRITTRLVSTTDGYQLWAESFERELEDIFLIQDEIASAVTDALGTALGVGGLPGWGTANVDAYDSYLRGRYWRHQRNGEAYERAIELLREAISLDPDFIEAWGELRLTLQDSPLMDPTLVPWARAQMRLLDERLLARAPDHPLAHQIRAETLARERDWVGAMDAYARARALSPPARRQCMMREELSRVLYDIDYALDCALRARAADPMSQTASFSVMMNLWGTGRQDEALAEYERGRALPSPSTISGGLNLMLAWHAGADRATIEALFEELVAQHADERARWEALVRWFDDHDQVRAHVRQVAAAITDDSSILLLPLIWLSAAAGDPALSVELFRRHANGGSFPLGPEVSFPIFADVRREPGFKELMRDWGFERYWRETRQWPDYCQPIGRDDFECF